ncbi:MAG: hypothetical protein KIS66_12115 [Fimbriimonadaceae bacterium]|nr:hypothetical protein [Fimbriimonadaceae bacterium]
MKNSMILKTVAIVAVIAMTLPAMAQGGRGQGGGGFGGRQGMMMGPGGGGIGMLVNRPDVQTELKLTDDQKKKLEAISQKSRDDRRAMMEEMRGGGGDRDAIMEKMRTMQTAQDKAINEVLTPDQKKRVSELAVQMAGSRYAMTPEGQKALGITSEQKSKLEELQRKQQEAMQGMFERMRNGEMDREEMQSTMQKATKVMDEEIAKVLTAEQKTKLEELKGKPFKFAEMPRGGGGG